VKRLRKVAQRSRAAKWVVIVLGAIVIMGTGAAIATVDGSTDADVSVSAVDTATEVLAIDAVVASPTPKLHVSKLDLVGSASLGGGGGAGGAAGGGGGGAVGGGADIKVAQY